MKNNQERFDAALDELHRCAEFVAQLERTAKDNDYELQQAYLALFQRGDEVIVSALRIARANRCPG